MAKGDTKTQNYLDIAANGTRADLPGDGCCNTRTQDLILGVAERVMDVEDEVEELKNNPDVVDIVDTYADLQAYDTQHLTENDIIRVLQDETHSGNSTYYRFTKNPDTWTFIGEISGGVNVVQTTGTSTTDVMSQNATTSMVYADPGTNTKIGIGYISTIGTEGIAIGSSSQANGARSVALGRGAVTIHKGSVAIGSGSSTSVQGEFNIAANSTQYGYNGTSYRLLTGLHDPVSDHDAATKGYVDANAGGGIKELTSADYDYPTESPDGIALWQLPNGFYKIGNTAYVKLYIGKAYAGAVMEGINLISDFLNVTGNGTVDSYIYVRRFKGNYTFGNYTLEGISSIRINKSTQVYDHTFTMGTTLEAKDVVDTGQLGSSITTADSILPLSAGAGKTLAQRLVVGLTAAPGNGTIGVVGTIATSIESGTPHLYMCTAASGSTKTWVQLI